MKKSLRSDDSEINLIELSKIIWKGKWKLVSAIVISFVIVSIYLSTQTKHFIATTKINAVSTAEENKYIAFNHYNKTAFKKYRKESKDNDNDSKNKIKNNNINFRDNTKNNIFFIVSKSNLFNLYIEVLNEKSIFIDAIKKFKLLDINQYANEQEYNEAVIQLASSIEILIPIERKNKTEEIIRFEYHDETKWKNVLLYVDEIANITVKKNLQDQFKTLLLSENLKKKYLIDDYSLSIDNLINDYERKISDKLSNLEEGSAMAEELGIAYWPAQEVIETKIFNNEDIFIADKNKNYSPFYLRGYEAINKEIEIIKSRSNIKPFIPELFNLEKRRRALSQNKTLERVELLFSTTPLADDKSFHAANINIYGTKYDYESNIGIIQFAIILGFVVGLFYVIISNAIKSNKY